MVALCALWGLAFATLTFIPCWPISAYWDAFVTNAHCWGAGAHDPLKYMTYFVAQATSSSVLDLTVYILAASLYFRLDAQRKTRLSLLGLFTLGLV